MRCSRSGNSRGRGRAQAGHCRASGHADRPARTGCRRWQRPRSGSGMARTGRARRPGPAGNPTRRPSRARLRRAEVLLRTQFHALLPDRPTRGRPERRRVGGPCRTQVPDRRRVSFRPVPRPTSGRRCGPAAGARPEMRRSLVDRRCRHRRWRYPALEPPHRCGESRRLRDGGQPAGRGLSHGPGLRTGSGRPSGGIDDAALRNPRQRRRGGRVRIKSHPASAA